MLSFSSYYDNAITESLDSPVEYFMTDDTKIPGEIYAKFDINGKPYTISLTETNTPGLYMLNMGKLMNKNVMWWKYHSPNDILPALSTLLHFSESSMFFLGSRVKGIIFRLWAPKAVMDRMTRVAERVIKKSFVKSFQYVNVTEIDNPKKDGNALRYVFVVRKGVAPQTLFKSAAFKLYDFEPNSGSLVNPIQSEVLDAVKVKKPLKNVVKTELSRKYSFKGMDVSTDSIDSDEFFEKVNSITEVVPPKADVVPEPEKVPMTPKEIETALTVIFDTILIDIKYKKGFDPESFQAGTILKKLKSTVPYLSNKSKSLLGETGFLDMKEKEQKEYTKRAMKSYYYGNYDSALRYKYIEMTSGISETKISTMRSNIDVNSLTSNVSKGFEVIGVKTNGNGWEVKYDGSKDGLLVDSVNYIEKDLGYKTQVEGIDDKLYDETNSRHIRRYSGSSYSSYNSPARSVAESLYNEIKPGSYDTENFQNYTAKLAKAFDTITPLPEPMWVYRSTSIPKNKIKDLKVGDDFVDPGFLSTSLDPNMGMGSDLFMRIYLPKGSKVLPILNYSSHSSEREVLLPAMSVIRLIEITNVNIGDQYYFTGLYIGNAYKDFERKILVDNAVKEQYNETYRGTMTMDEQTKKDETKGTGKYDKNDKYGGSYDVDLGKKIADDIRKGKIKLGK